MWCAGLFWAVGSVRTFNPIFLESAEHEAGAQGQGRNWVERQDMGMSGGIQGWII